MNEEDVLIVRENRCRIAGLCNDVFWGDWDMICTQFQEIEEDLELIIKGNDKEQEILRQCRQCINKKNILRLRDLLAYELDSGLAQRLVLLSERERISLANRAKEENVEVLRIYHPNIYDKLNSEDEARIDCYFEGTDNVTLTAWEDGHNFRMYSNINPWRESIDFVNCLVGENNKLQEICVLGFGGGYAVGELIRRFPLVTIKVFIPNIAVFQAVMDHISISHILSNPNIQLFYDYGSFVFFGEIGHNIECKKKAVYYIDRQELRVIFANNKIGKTEIAPYWHGVWQGNSSEITKGKENIGEKIKQYIKNVNM